jgi:hypothetical protein
LICDSKNIIKNLVLNTSSGDIHLASLLEMIHREVKTFLKVKYFHVLREHNALANHCANQAMLLKMGEIMVNGNLRHQPIS